MPSNVVVNFLTTQHKASVGTTAAFPDVCKTPAPPAPSPVPIPYPNVGQSMMASSKVTKKVKDNKQKVMVKGSNYTMTNGDQPGVALGVISNKIMGKSGPQNYSFNVKFEGKNVTRLTDLHGNNSGSKPNAVNPAQVQAPSLIRPGMTSKQKKACKRLNKKQVPPKDRDQAALDHGMLPEHANAMSRAAQGSGMSATVRKSNTDCLGKMRDGFPTKPCGAGGSTISNTANLPASCKGLVGAKKGASGKFKGLVSTDGSIIPAKDIIKAQKKDPKGFKNWLKKKGAMTGDYDLHDVFDKGGKRAKNASKAEKGFIDAANSAMGRTDPKHRMVQHGPQANVKEFFDANPDKKKSALDKFGQEKFDNIQQPDVRRKPPEPLLHFDKNGGMYKIDNERDLKDLYACKGADYPAHWENPPPKPPKAKP